MSYLSAPKKIAAIAIIVAVLLIPVLLTINDQGVQNALSVFGIGGGAGDLDKYLTGSAKYNDTAVAAAEPATSAAREERRETSAAPARTPEPAVNSGVMDSVRIVSTPKPKPTPTPKWTPEIPATDGKVMIDGLVEEDSVNVLIIGIDRTAYLADTLGIVSISPSAQTVRLIMFGRDLYIGYSDHVKKNLEKLKHTKLPGIYKINNVHNVAKNSEKYTKDIVYNQNRFEKNEYDFLAQVIYEKFDIRVDDFIQINTYGLVKLVDLFGGVRVYVPVTMRYHDPDQNLKINISKGTQVLNGANAEGFVRFRQGYDAKGNLTVMADRTKNQIAFLKAFYEQHAKLSNINKIPMVMDTIKRNIIHSISADDIFTVYGDILTAVAKESYSFESVEFDYGQKRVNGNTYYTIKGILKDEE